MKTMHVGSTSRGKFSLPVDFVTQTSAILARKGAGKTYAAQVMAEGLLNAGQQVAVIDPLNAWWGLRSSANGRRGGFPIVVFGGPRGDVPLTEAMGSALADLVAENPQLSCVMSLRHLTKGKMRRFIDDFATRLFHRKGEEKLATAMHLFIDESDLSCPQRVMANTAHLVGAMEDLVRRGRQAGIGVTMITQRSASLNKDVLTQVELLITGQITGPQDKKAVQEWIKENADDAKQKEFMSSLATLDTGEMWFWSPAWLKRLTRVNVRTKTTFDSSATPKYGKRIALPKKAAKIDIKALRAGLEQVVEEAEQNDPRKLKRRVAELEKELQKKVAPAKDTAPVVQSIAQQGYTQKEVEAAVAKAVAEVKENILENVGSIYSKLYVDASEHATAVQRAMFNSEEEIGKAKPSSIPKRLRRVWSKKAEADLKKVMPEPVGLIGTPLKSFSVAGTKLAKCPRAILTVLAQRGRSCSRRLVALQSGYSIKSSGFSNALSSLSTLCFVERNGRDLKITQEGVDALGEYEPLPQQLLEHWMGKIGKCPRAILQVLWEASPQSVTREELAERTNYSLQSSGFSNALSTLRGLELVEGKGDLRLTDEVEG